MKKLILLSILLTTAMATMAQTEYVCVPCGYACDNEIHKNSGPCAMCNMKLVEKSSIKFNNLTFEEFAKRIEEVHGRAIFLAVMDLEK